MAIAVMAFDLKRLGILLGRGQQVRKLQQI